MHAVTNVCMKYIYEVNNNTTSDNDIISDAFNKFYINIGPTLASKIPYCQKNPLSYIHQNISDSMYLNEVTVSEVKNVIVSLKEASPGWDDIHAKIIKCTYN